jgi:enoyl-CoA hydratase/carnithine racemase
MPDLVGVSTDEHASVVPPTSEPRLNAISAMEQERCVALQRSEVRGTPRVICATGPNGVSAGTDLNEMQRLDPASIIASYRATGDFGERVADYPQPPLSASSSYGLGGGPELALATDVRIAERGAVIGLAELGMGIPPSSGGTRRPVRQFAPARAKGLILVRPPVGTVGACPPGPVTEFVQQATALRRALEPASRPASVPPLAVSVTREVIDSMSKASRLAGLALERLADRLHALVAALNSVGAGSISRSGCTSKLRDGWRHRAMAMYPRVRAAKARGADSLRQAVSEMNSGAVDDAGVLAAAGVATGIVRARSTAGGVSHTPEEDSDAEATSVATRVLASTLAGSLLPLGRLLVGVATHSSTMLVR